MDCIILAMAVLLAGLFIDIRVCKKSKQYRCLLCRVFGRRKGKDSPCA